MDSLDSLAARYALAARHGFLDPKGQLSAVGAALLAQQTLLGSENEQPAADLRALEQALDREFQIIGRYQDIIESCALDAPARTLVVLFQNHHVEHSEALSALLGEQGASVPLLHTHTSLGEGVDTPTQQPAALQELVLQEHACSEDYIELAATCGDPRFLRALMRLATQCAQRAGAFTQAAGKAFDMRSRRLDC